jgi:uncharacterized repeat protein (TIGR03803 family)
LSSYKLLVPLLAAGILAAPIATATTFETLYRFAGKADGLGAYGGFASDSAGVLYGITSNGGNFDHVHCGDGCGTIFSVDPATGKFVSLHRFAEAEGISLNSPLVSGGGKIFYGSSGFGGPGVTGGGGTIFKFDAGAGTVTVLYTLKGDNGTLNSPATSVTLANGGLYGSAVFGGPGDFGGIYRLDLATKALKLVYAFGGTAPKPAGYNMNIGMVLGKDGMIYGATLGGGPKYTGMLFRINPTTQKFAALHAIDDGNGGTISGALAVAPDGTLYGTTSQGGTAKYSCGGSGCGAVFKFNPTTLKFTVLHSFTGGVDGGFPEGSTAISGNGAVLYGVTGFGGAHKQGALYEINLATDKLTVLYAFTGGAGGGIQRYRLPSLALRGGRLYGTTNSGGYPNACNNQGCGTVFRLTP